MYAIYTYHYFFYWWTAGTHYHSIDLSIEFFQFWSCLAGSENDTIPRDKWEEKMYINKKIHEKLRVFLRTVFEPSSRSDSKRRFSTVPSVHPVTAYRCRLAFFCSDDAVFENYVYPIKTQFFIINFLNYTIFILQYNWKKSLVFLNRIVSTSLHQSFLK